MSSFLHGKLSFVTRLLVFQFTFLLLKTDKAFDMHLLFGNTYKLVNTCFYSHMGMEQDKNQREITESHEVFKLKEVKSLALSITLTAT